MEAYSIAKFCHLNRINFYCYKYISDNANNEAANDWEENIQNGAMDFIKTLESNLK
jgi:adenosylhomocysteine nucleosidase